MKSYNRDVIPPAPFLDLVVYYPDDPERVVSLKAKIDTTADVSAVPISLVAQLELPMVSKLIIEGYDGISASMATYSVKFEIEQIRFKSQEIIAIPKFMQFSVETYLTIFTSSSTAQS